MYKMSRRVLLTAVASFLFLSSCVSSISTSSFFNSIWNKPIGVFKVTVSEANIRSGPGRNYNIVGKLYQDSNHPILEIKKTAGDEYGWYKIAQYKESEQWVNGAVGVIVDIKDKSFGVFNASPENAWLAVLSAIKWMRWEIAVLDEKNSQIKLREAYVYRKSGKFLRIYFWPKQEDLRHSDIKQYLDNISKRVVPVPVGKTPNFSQEQMLVSLFKLSKSEVGVQINYEFITYYDLGNSFVDRVESSGHIESKLLEKIEEFLTGKPVL